MITDTDRLMLTTTDTNADKAMVMVMVMVTMIVTRMDIRQCMQTRKTALNQPLNMPPTIIRIGAPMAGI